MDGSDPPLAMPSAGIAEGWDVHIPDTLPGGSLPSNNPCGKANGASFRRRIRLNAGAAIGHIASPARTCESPEARTVNRRLSASKARVCRGSRYV